MARHRWHAAAHVNTVSDPTIRLLSRWFDVSLPFVSYAAPYAPLAYRSLSSLSSFMLQSKSLHNGVDSVVTEAIDGFLMANQQLARLDGFPDVKVVVRGDWAAHRDRKVPLLLH